jgi:rhodanese-related sulfurtransferase
LKGEENVKNSRHKSSCNSPRKPQRSSQHFWVATGLLGVVLAAGGARADDAKKDAGPTSITPGELSELIQLEKPPLILDVRSKEEYTEAHIPGAVNIPHDQLADHLSDLHAAKTDEIVVHCRSGYRAGIAEKVLSDAGYSNVRDLDGHMNAWQAGGYPVEKP